MGKTYKDIRKQDVKTSKKIAREATMDMDLRTRVKPLDKREKGGGKNRTKQIVGEYMDELDKDWEEFSDFFNEDEF